MGFASDSHVPFGPSDRGAFSHSEQEKKSAEADDVDWTPGPVPAQSDADLGPSAAAEDVNPDDTWVPAEGAEDSSADGSAAGSSPTAFDPNTTWVPPNSPRASSKSEQPESEQPESKSESDLDPNKTWVPSGTPTADGVPPDSEDDSSLDDPSRTWVPSSTPTMGGVDSEDEDDAVDPNRTWVPSSTPTADGIDPSDEDDAVDPDRTWMPSSTPTTDGLIAGDDESSEDADPFEKTWVAPISPTADGSSDNAFPDSELPASDAAVQDVDKTWVPTSSPTADGVNDEEIEEDEQSAVGRTWAMPVRPDRPKGMIPDQPQEDDANRTWVPSTTPTASGSAKSQMPVELTETVNLRAGAPPAVPEVRLDDTVELDRDGDSKQAKERASAKDQLTADGGDVFQKTIGMRRPLDASDLPPAAMMDSEGRQTIHLDLPDHETNQLNANATQLWSRQSGADLNQSLTIRSRPVAGDAQFETEIDSPDEPDYQIVEKIGEGGMGAIFLATQTSLDRQLAIKTLKAPRNGARFSSGSGRHSSSADRQRRDMFLAEALITANLVHPHIIPIHDLCETAEGLPFYSMKRVVGTPWCERLRDMELDENLEVLMKVCDAIAYAHHNGVVNRDLKPENVMLGEFGEVLVLDWGLAVPSSAADKKKFNSPSAPFGAGTPAYMAPELWTGPEEIIGYWSDIYLLGAILFEIITGKAPHKFAEPAAKAGHTGLWMVIDKVVRRNDIRPTNHAGELMDVALMAMQTRPKDRFESVLKFQEALKQFQHHEESRRLASRASETLQTAEDSKSDIGYLGYQSAAALFEEAQAAWAENADAAEGLRDTRLQYAGLAHRKGDYDLGLQIASQEDGPAFTEIRRKLIRSRRLRNTLKSAIIAASAIIVVVGIFSFIQSREIAKQNQQIIALNGTRESLQADITSAQDEILDAEAKRIIADQKAVAAESRAIVAAEEVESANLEVAAADFKLLESNDKLHDADRLLDLATTKLQQADTKLVAANATLKDTEQKVGELQIKKSRSAVDLKNAEIASLIRNGDYSNALTEVERLLLDLAESEEMNSLPASEQQQRKTELQARRRQLLQRAVQVDVPVQSQVISQSGQQVVWADQDGKLQVRRYSKEDGVSDQVLAETQLQKPAFTLVASEQDNVVLAADGADIKVWDFQADQTKTLSGHQAKVTTIRSTGDFVISADESGSIRAWSMKTSKQLWSIRSSSRIVDLVLLPDDLIFIYAGSRGGESADILAYQLGGLSDSSERPTRLGQLKFPRDRNDPPRALAVSPDGQRLLISNSRNGRVLVLPKRNIVPGAGRDQFPFVHVTDLDNGSAKAAWVADRHQRPVNQISFSKDGSRFCTASDDRTIGVWEFTEDGSPKLLERLEGHGARVNSASFADQAGQQVVSIAADRYCRCWDVERYQADKKQLEQEFRLSNRSPPSPNDETYFEFGDARQSIGEGMVGRLPELVATSMLMQRDLFKTVIGFAFALVDEDLQTSDEIENSQSSGSRTFNLEPGIQRGAITSVTVSADGKLLTTGGSDGTAVIWDTESGRPLNSISTSASSSTNEAAFDEGHDFNVSRFRFLPPDGKHLLTTGFDGNLCVWNADTEKSGTGHQTLRMPGLGLVNAIATSANGQYVITSALDDDQTPGVCSVYRMSDLLKADEPKPVSEFTGFHTSEISAISIDYGGRLAVTGGRDGRVALWSCADGQLIAAGRIHTKNTIVSYLKILDDGRILTAGYDGRLLLLKANERTNASSGLKTFDVNRRFVHDRIPIERVAVHPDQNRFVTISIRTERKTRKIQYELSLWDVDQQDAARRIVPAVVEGRAAVRISSIDFSADGKQLAAVVDQRIQVLDSETWKVVRVVGAAGAGISDAIFSPTIDDDESKQRIATFDGVAAHLWDLKTGRQLAAFRPLFSVASLAQSQHERPLLLTGDRSIRFFQAAANDKRFGRCVFKIEDPHMGIVNALAFNPVKNDVFASSGSDGAICFWRWEQDQEAAVLIRRVSGLHAKGNAIEVNWSADGQSVWVADQFGGLKKFDEDGNVILDSQVLANQNVELADLAIRSDGRFIAVCGKGQNGGLSTAWIFEQVGDGASDSEKLVVHCRLDGHEAGGIKGIRFLPDSPYVVTAGADGACLVWNWMPERFQERPIEAYEAFQFLSPDSRVAHRAPINAISVTDQGHVATVSDDGTARLWRNPFRKSLANSGISGAGVAK